jgi:PGF-pre-PGF domain-containing protein
MKYKRQRGNLEWFSISIFLIAFILLFAFILIKNDSGQSNIVGYASSLSLNNTLQTQIGKLVVIELKANDVNNLAGLQTNIKYDSSILSFVSINKGVFLSSGIGLDKVYLLDGPNGTLDTSTPGLIKDLVIFRETGGASGSGVIATISFNTIGSGNSVISFENMLIANSSGSEIIMQSFDSTINVEINDAQPFVQITSPTQGQRVSSSMTVETLVTEATNSVSFYLDGQLLSTDNSAPFQATINNALLVNGIHQIYATATNGATTTTSPTITFNTTGGISEIHLIIEAELGQRSTFMNIQSAGTIKYIEGTSKASGNPTVSYNITFPRAGNYYVWGNAYAPSSNSDTFEVSLDNSNKQTYFVNASTGQYSFWQWTRVNNNGIPRTFYIPSAGAHVFTFEANELNTRLDKIYITNSPNSQPNSIISTDNVNPSISLTIPILPFYHGIIPVSAQANDNYGISGVYFFRNQRVYGGPDNLAPYTASIDFSNSIEFPDGPHSITGMALDLSGRASNNTKNIIINNTCTDQDDTDDNDGVPGCFDLCRNTSSQHRTRVNKYGCPLPQVGYGFSQELTTNFSLVDLRNFINFKIGLANKGSLDFKDNNISLLKFVSNVYNPVNLSEVIKFQGKSVIVRSDLIPTLNKSAKVKLYELEDIQRPLILIDGKICGTNCTIDSVDISEKSVTFNVLHFTNYTVSVGSFCGDGFPSADESCSSCPTDVGTCAPITPSSDNTGSSGDSSPSTSSPSGSSTSQPYTKTFSFLDSTIKRIKINFLSQKEQATLELSEIRNTYSPEGIEYYKTFSVFPKGFTNQDINSTEWEFSVPRSWIEENNIDERTINLYRLNEGSWNFIASEKTQEISGEIYYKAKPLGFSIFIIGGSKQSSTTTIDDSNNNANLTDNVDEKPKIDKTIVYLIVIILLITSIIIITIIIIKTLFSKKEESIDTFAPIKENEELSNKKDNQFI